MSDLLGEIGLDTKDIEGALGRVSQKLTMMAVNANDASSAMTLGLLATTAKLAEGLIEAADAAKKFNDEVTRISTNAASGGIKSISELERGIKDTDVAIKELTKSKSALDAAFQYVASSHLLGGAGYDEVIKRQDEQLKNLQRSRAAFDKQIGEALDQTNKVLEQQINHEDELAALKKNEIKYTEQINALRKQGLSDAADGLTVEMKLTAELIKQNALYNDPVRKATSAKAEEEARNAIGADVGDERNKQIIDDREADKKQKLIDDQRAFDAAQYQEFLASKDVENQIKSDFESEEFKKFRAGRDAENQGKTDFESEEYKKFRSNKDADNQEKADFELAEYKKFLSNQDAKKRAFAAENKELQGELTVTDLARRGNLTKAGEEKTAQDFDRKIRDAIRSGNKDGEEILRKQANAAQAGFDVEDSKKSPLTRSAERAAGRATVRDEANADRQNRDLDDRLARGAKGDKDSRLEQRREENARNANRAAGQEDTRKGLDDADDKGYGKTDRGFLREIRDALKPKD